jgi:hypothetical protein
MRGGDIQKDQLIRALLLIASGKLHRIALPLKINELDPLDHGWHSVYNLDIQAGHYLGIAFPVIFEYNSFLLFHILSNAVDQVGYIYVPLS